MGCQRNWLARLLAYTTRLKALEKEDRCHTTYGLSLQCHGTMHVHRLRKLLLWHVAKPCTYPKSVDRSIWFEKESSYKFAWSLCFTSFSLVILNTKDQVPCNKIWPPPRPLIQWTPSCQPMAKPFYPLPKHTVGLQRVPRFGSNCPARQVAANFLPLTHL